MSVPTCPKCQNRCEYWQLLCDVTFWKCTVCGHITVAEHAFNAAELIREWEEYRASQDKAREAERLGTS